MPRKLPPLDLDDLIRSYYAGAEVSELAAQVGVSSISLYRRFKAAGVLSRLGSQPWEPEAVRLYDEGCTVAEVARRLDVARNAVRHEIVAAGRDVSRSEGNRRRLAAMTPEERSDLASAAHAAVRGMTRTEDELIKRAISKERTQSGGTDDERAIGRELEALGIPVTFQQATGKYNIDIGASPVAVELFGGGWHAHGTHRARLPQRVKDLADAGWNLLIAWTHDAHPLIPAAVAQDALAYHQLARRDPSFRRRYRVIWGDGKFIAAGSVDDDKVTLIPVGIRGVYSARR